MLSTFTKKSFSDLKKRKSRTIFSIITIILAVSAIGVIGVVDLMHGVMNEEIRSSNLHDISIHFNDAELNKTHMEGLRNLHNIESVEPKYIFFTRIYVEWGKNNAFVVGIEDFLSQNVDKVKILSGSEPGNNTVLADYNNNRLDLSNGEERSTVSIYDYRDSVREMSISGKGSTFMYSQIAFDGIYVFYTTLETANTLANSSGYNMLSFDLRDTSEEKVIETYMTILKYLENETPIGTSIDSIHTRINGDWDGKEELINNAKFFYIMIAIIVICSLFLISNTMHTMISEQKKEIAILKAVGAGNLQVLKLFLTSAFIIGFIGSIFGMLLGILNSYVILYFICSTSYGLYPTFRISSLSLILCLIIGIGMTILAIIPTLFINIRVNVKDGLRSTTTNPHKYGRFFKGILIITHYLPRTFQLGIRNITRKRGRSLTTISQIALAVGLFLAIASYGYSTLMAIENELDVYGHDINCYRSDGKPFDIKHQSILEGIEGVAKVEPSFFSTAYLPGFSEVYLHGYNYDTFTYLHEKTIYKGRWFSEGEQENNTLVAIISQSLARHSDLDTGDTIKLELVTGKFNFTIIGLDKNPLDEFMTAYVPINTLQNITENWNNVTSYNIKTTTSSRKSIENTATKIVNNLNSHGIEVMISFEYWGRKADTKEMNNLLSLMIAVGTLVIIVSMIGLMSTITLNMIERKNEIGIMRCIGSSSFHLISIFTIEAIIISILGWIIGTPLGFLLGYYLNIKMNDYYDIKISYAFPLYNIFLALIVTVILSLIMIQFPLWRATHMHPIEAIRYE